MAEIELSWDRDEMVYWNSVLLTRPGAKLVDRPLWHNLAHAFAAASISCNLRSHMRNIGPNKRTTTLLREWFNRLRGWFERKILHEEDWAFDLPNGTEAAFEYSKIIPTAARDYICFGGAHNRKRGLDYSSLVIVFFLRESINQRIIYFY